MSKLINLIKEVQVEKGFSTRFILDGESEVYFPITSDGYPIDDELLESGEDEEVQEQIMDIICEKTELSAGEVENILDNLGVLAQKRVQEIEDSLGFLVNAINLPIESLKGGEF